MTKLTLCHIIQIHHTTKSSSQPDTLTFSITRATPDHISSNNSNISIKIEFVNRYRHTCNRTPPVRRSTNNGPVLIGKALIILGYVDTRLKFPLQTDLSVRRTPQSWFWMRPISIWRESPNYRRVGISRARHSGLLSHRLIGALRVERVLNVRMRWSEWMLVLFDRKM